MNDTLQPNDKHIVKHNSSHEWSSYLAPILDILYLQIEATNYSTTQDSAAN